ncbi:hypothetical protein Salat_0521600 [Sesamum alatum]|uniref:Uncharacterized protein n=1 Tax=Sesamum alatum TaxID=300844 RepID=A0AAE1Z4R1_9LAMI|nr:hypothetical protein Salat_0521600 [Sesamum alatum]
MRRQNSRRLCNAQRGPREYSAEEGEGFSGENGGIPAEECDAEREAQAADEISNVTAESRERTRLARRISGCGRRKSVRTCAEVGLRATTRDGSATKACGEGETSSPNCKRHASWRFFMEAHGLGISIVEHTRSKGEELGKY